MNPTWSKPQGLARKTFRCSWLAVAGALLAVAAWADPIDSFVEAQLKNGKIPGLALAVVREGKLEKVKGYTFALTAEDKVARMEISDD